MSALSVAVACYQTSQFVLFLALGLQMRWLGRNDGRVRGRQEETRIAGAMSRRRLLRTSGAVGAAGAIGAAVAFPGRAYAVTNDVLRDQGGAVFNVRSTPWNAVGNGTTDDRAAIQAAINAAAAAGGARCFYLRDFTGSHRR
jgi:hypothetical protein